MMERILEPEYMDTVTEAESYASMDHADVNRSVAEDFLATGCRRGLALDIGTGPGDVPLLLAIRAPELRWLAVDAAGEMLRIARRRVRDAGVRERVTLLRADGKILPFADGKFDAVLSNTILHHLPEPIALLAETRRVLRPGGALMIRDLYRPATEEEVSRLIDRHAGGATAEQRKLLSDSLHAALTLEEARQAARDAGMADARVQMTSDRHYTITIDSSLRHQPGIHVSRAADC